LEARPPHIEPLPTPMPERTSFLARLRALVAEAHRRSVWQVLAVYGVVSWMGYEVILGITDGVGLPDWVPAFAIVLFIIGLPLVLATAIVQEGGPERLEPRAEGSEERPTHGPPAGPATESAAEAARAAEPAATPEAVREAPPGADGVRRVFTWRRVLAAGMAAFAALGLGTAGFMGMRALGIGPAGTLVSTGALEAREPLVVADFQGMSDGASLARVVTEGLRADLAQSPFVTAADRARVRETLQRMMRPDTGSLDPETAREVALRLGLKAVIEGDVGRAGSGYLLMARVVTADSGRTLASFRETAADSTALLDAIEALSHSLRERVGESLRTVRASAPLAEVTTSSLAALRLAAEAWSQQSAGNRSSALPLMRQAVEVDPEFASAWMTIAVMHYNNGDREAMLAAIREALAHEDRLDAQSRHMARGLYASITGDHRSAAVEEQARAALDPTNPQIFINLSDGAWNLGEWAEAAEHAARALALDSSRWVGHWNLVVALIDDGRIDEAAAAAGSAAQILDPGMDIPDQLVEMVLAQEARYDSIHARASHPARAAHADRVMGRWEEAQSHYDAAGFGDYGAWLVDLDRLFAIGDTAAAARLEAGMDSVLDVSPAVPERMIAELALGMAVAGRSEAAARAAAAYGRRVPAEVRWSDAFLLHATDAFVALHEGRGAEALDRLRRARASTAWPAPVDALLGRAYDALGRPDSAISAYTRYVDTPWSYRLGFFNTFADPMLLAPTHERLALLHEEAGDLEAAARHAAVVAELWADADAPLQPRLAGVRRILERAASETRPRGRPAAGSPDAPGT
jgi:tetratricopeptide (TPR) repeat protein